MTARLVRNLTAVTVAAGLATVGLVGQADAAPAATTLTIHAAHATYVYGQKAAVSGHLSVPNAAGVSIAVAVAGHGTQNVAVTVNSSGNWAIKGTTTNNTTFTVVYPGDGTHAAAKASTRIRTRVKVISRLRGGYKTKAGYRYVHAGKRPAFAGGVAPVKAGKKIYFRLQVFRKHHWRAVQNKGFAMSKDGVAGITFRGVKGYRFRIRAEYRGDSTNASNVSAWTHVRFV